MAAALKFTQGVNVGVTGRALQGVVGQPVTVSNDAAADSYSYTMLSVPIGSGLSIGSLGTASTASFTPDVSGCYRVRVTVVNGATTTSMIRVFGVANARGWIIPAFDGDAIEHNFEGQSRGWAGTTTVKLLDYILDDLTDAVTATLTAPTLAEAGYLVRANGSEDLEYIAGTNAGQSAVWNGTSVVFGSVDLGNVNAVTGRLTSFASLPQVPSAVLLGRYSAGSGDIQTLTLNSTLVLDGSGIVGRAAINGDITMAAGSNTAAITANVIVDADINATAAISYSKLADAPGTSVLARASGTVGALAAVAASANNQVFRRDGTGVLGFGPINLADSTNAVSGQLPLANIVDLAGLSFLGRAAATPGVAAAISGSAGQVARVAADGLSLGFGTIDLSLSATVGTSKLALSNIVDLSAVSVLGRAGGTSGTMAAIAAANDNEVLMRSSGVLLFAPLSAANIPDGTVTLPKLASIATDSLLGRDTAGTGAVEVIGLNATLSMTGAGQLQRAALTGDVTAAAGSNTTAIAANVIVNADINTSAAIAHSKLASLAALSVLGRSADTPGAMAAISGTADQVLLVSGVTLGFGLITDANITSNTITLGKLAGGSAASVVGRAAATGGTYADIVSTADGQALVRVSGVLTFGTLATAGLGDGTVTVTKLADLAGLSVIGRAANTPGVPAAITATATGQVLRYSGTTIGFGALDLADADAVTGLLPGTNVNPNFGSQNIITTGTLSLGTTPAVTGNMRVPHGFSVLGRDSTNAADRTLFRWGSITDELSVGSPSNVRTTVEGGALTLSTGSGTIIAQIAATTHFTIAANALTGSGVLSLGTNPASAGQLRLPNATDIRWRSVGGSSDVIGIRVDSSDTVSVGDVSATGIRMTSAGVIGLRVGGTDQLTLTSSSADFLDNSISTTANLTVGTGITNGGAYAGGTNPATAGIIRLPNGDSSGSGIQFRNAANDGNVRGLSVSSGNTLVLGDSADTFIGISQSANTVTVTSGGTTVATFGATTFVGDTTAVSALSLYTSGARLILGTNIEIQNASQFRFDSGVTGGVTIIHEDDATTALATANKFAIHAQNRTGTGTTVGAELELASGTGATAGALTLKVGNTTVLQGNDLGSGREVLGLFGAVTTTQMPSNTGDRVLHWADATTMPTTGFPTGGGILGVDSSLGLQWKGKNGVETTIAQHGDSGNTTKRRMIGWKSVPQRTTMATATGPTTVASFDVASLNGGAVTNGIFKAICHYIARGNGYAACAEYIVFIDVVAGVVTVGPTQNVRVGVITNGGPFSAFVVDSSGTVVRARATTHATSGSTEIFSWFELAEFEP